MKSNQSVKSLILSYDWAINSSDVGEYLDQNSRKINFTLSLLSKH